MAGEGYTHPSYEASDKTSDDSEDNPKSKSKKKSGEAPARKPEQTADKKEVVADRGKDLWSKLLKEEKPGKTAESKDNGSAADAEEKPAEAPEDGGETSEIETPADGETELTPEENSEVDERLKQANVEELQAEIAATDDEQEIAASQAAIEAVENLPGDELAVETDAPAPADEADEVAPEHEAVAFGDEDEPLPLTDEEDIPLTPPTPTGGTTGGTARGSGRGTGSTGTPPPPIPPRPPRGSSGAPQPALGGQPPRRPGAPANRFNVLPAPNQPAARTAEYQPDYRQNPNATYLLVGGIVGYLIGRRRGRIKTEKRLNTVVKKLEKQVEAKQRVIDATIENAKQRARREYWASKAEHAPAAAPAEAVPAPRVERQAAQPAANRPEAAAARPATPQRLETKPKTEVMDRRQLIEASRQVRFGETNLARVYEAQLVDEAGLRRLIRAAEEGHDLRRALAREFLARELRFERDPRLKGGSADAGGAATGGGTAFAGSLAAAAADQSDTSEPVPAAPTQQAAPQSGRRSGQQTNVSPATLIVLTLFTLALAIYAIWLTLTR